MAHPTLIQTILYAIFQGITELFPISSLGHAVLLPYVVGWQIDQRSEAFLPFLVALHLGTATALLLYFRADWLAFLVALRAPRDPKHQEELRVLLLVVAGTVPAGLLGLLFEKRLRALFANPHAVAVFLMLNGLLLLGGEILRRRLRHRQLADIGIGRALVIGTAQALALLPGFSRSGATLVGGLLAGLSHEAAARFAFLLATPIIGAAAVLELPKLLRPEYRAELGLAALGGLAAGLTAYVTTALLMRYFRAREVDALVPFGVYCLLVGAAAFFLLR